MPSFNQHTIQAEHNKELLEFIGQYNKQAHNLLPRPDGGIRSDVRA
ncbi:MAG: hypothetical protein FWC23_06205 [Chitinispirillia bacterium]|nr:hypothetical protein [Chitinispirillia bacterium]